MGFLIDTCVWIDVEQGVLSPADVAMVTGDDVVYLSPVTLAELKFGAEVATDPAVRQKRLVALRRLQRKPLLSIDAATGITFGELVAGLKLSGKGYRRRVQDLWLASQAVQHGFTLLTRNGNDFIDIPALEVAII